MKKIEAFKCEHTGAVFEDQQRAVKSEFRALMKRVGGSFPHMGSVNSTDIMNWLASNIESGVYPAGIEHLDDAIKYFRDNQEIIAPSRYLDPPFPASCAGE